MRSEPALAAFRAFGVRRHSAHGPQRLTVCGSCPALGTSPLQSSNAAASPSSNAVRDPARPSRGFIAFTAAARCRRTAATSTRTAGGLAPGVATRNTTTRPRRGRRCAPRPERLAARGLEPDRDRLGPHGSPHQAPGTDRYFRWAKRPSEAQWPARGEPIGSIRSRQAGLIQPTASEGRPRTRSSGSRIGACVRRRPC